MKQSRDYQIEATRAIDREHETVASTLLVLATGLGKTHVMSKVASQRSSKGHVLMLAHRVELLDQAADHFAPELGYRPEIIQADREVDWHGIGSHKKVVVASVQTLRGDKWLARIMQYPWSLLLVDEAHHATAASYRKIEKAIRDRYPGLKTLGVTATPNRTDKKALGIAFDSVAYQLDAAEGIDLGWLVSPIEERVIIEGVDFRDIPMIFNEFGEPDFSPSAIEALMIEEKPLQAVAAPLIDRSQGKQALVFTAGVAHAHMLKEILNRHEPGSAAALDGKSTPPGHPDRTRIIKDFRNGRIRFICNFGVATEGTDLPNCNMIVVARPTKSKLILTQMVGRALRPLPGVVDGHVLAEVRRAAIAASPKPIANVLYFSPAAANIATATTYDALGGNYDDEVIALAKTMNEDEPGRSVTANLKEAAILAPVLAQNALRKKLKAEVQYRTEAVNGASSMAAQDFSIPRGGCSDKQIEQLIGMGVGYETAAKYSAKQAWTVLDKLRAERCTVKQQRILERYGENPNVNYHEAKAIIDEIANNGWNPRTQTSGATA